MLRVLRFSIALLGIVAAGGAFAQSADFEVTTLGTGSPTPDIARFSNSTLVKAGKQTLLFDAGRGVTMRLWQGRTAMGSINAVFLTHYHSDHTVGLPDLWLTGWLASPFGGRKSPMLLFGPEGAKELMAGLQRAYAADIKIRVADQKLATDGVEVKVTEIKEGVVYTQDGVTVTAIEVDHGDLIKPAFGYRVDYDGRSVVISGDTRPSENLIKHATGASLVIHSVGAIKDELLKGPKGTWYTDILNHHTKPAEAGTVFTRIQPKLAVYSHFVLLGDLGVTPPTVPDVIEETRKTYKGPLVASEDLMRFTITKDAVNVTPPAK